MVYKYILCDDFNLFEKNINNARKNTEALHSTWSKSKGRKNNVSSYPDTEMNPSKITQVLI
jgi:hypothetical protein